MQIIHRCTNCRHPNTWGNGVTCSGYVIGCNCGQKCTYGPPETLHRIRTDGTQVTAVMEPGVSEAGWTAGCTCADCKALYVRLAAVAESLAVAG